MNMNRITVWTPHLLIASFCSWSLTLFKQPSFSEFFSFFFLSGALSILLFPQKNPFVKEFNTLIVLDEKVLSDPRIIDLISTGIFNHRLILPFFIIKHFKKRAESLDGLVQKEATQILFVIEALKKMKDLHLKISNLDFNDTFELQEKIIQFAQYTHCTIFTSQQSRIDSHEKKVSIIDLLSIENALKKGVVSGEVLLVKVQRYGKEIKQGVGYLEDGTMVVINNGGDFIGETLQTQVISLKHTSAGRILFTNALIPDEKKEFAYPNVGTDSHEGG